MDAVEVNCFGGPLHEKRYSIPAGETHLEVVKTNKPLHEFEPGEAVPVDVVRGIYKLALGVDGKIYMLWEGWKE